MKTPDGWSQERLAAAAAVGLPVGSSTLCSEGEVTQRLSWREIHRIGPGLFNLGNTCFLNATLQCLAYLAPFVQLLRNDDGRVDELSSFGASVSSAQSFAVANGASIDWLAIMKKHLTKVQEATAHGTKTVSPKGVASHIRWAANSPPPSTGLRNSACSER
jgi:ubiquitin C-terminal hydrolase